MANQFGVDLGAAFARAEEIKAARIANQFRPRALELAQTGAEQQNAMGAIQLQQAQQGMTDDNALRAQRETALAGSTAPSAGMAIINPAEAAKFEGYIAGLDEAGKAKVAESIEQMGQAAAWVQSQPDPAAAYKRALELFPPELVKDAPAEYDAQWVDVQLAKALNLKDLLSTSAGGEVKPQTPIGKLKADLDANLMTLEQYAAAVAKELETSKADGPKPYTDAGRLKADLDAGFIPQETYDALTKQATEGEKFDAIKNAPAGYMWASEDRSRLIPVPGGPKDPKSAGGGGLDSATANAIRASVVLRLGGLYDPATGEISGVGKDEWQRSIDLMAEAERIAAEEGLSPARAVQKAFEGKGGSSGGDEEIISVDENGNVIE